MQNQSTNLFIFLNSVFTAANESVVYKKEDDLLLPENPKRFIEFLLPKVVNKDDVLKVLITTCKKNETSVDEEYFKLLVPKRECFFLEPSFRNDLLKVDLGNIGIDSEDELTDPYIKKIQEVFKEQKETKEREFLGRIFIAKKIISCRV